MRYRTTHDIIFDLENNPIEDGGNIYHPIPFPEFKHLKTSSDPMSATKKLQIIEKVIKDLFTGGLNNKEVLDIGGNAGFYTFSLAKKGISVTTFEPHPRYGLIGNFLAKEKGLNIKWNPTSFDETKVYNKQFDLTLMMSVFQWMAKGGKNIDEATRQLRFISQICTYLIFELGFNSGKSAMKTAKYNHYAELIHLLKENTAYENFKLIGKTNAWGGHSTRFMVLCSNQKELEDSLGRRLQRAIRF